MCGDDESYFKKIYLQRYSPFLFEFRCFKQTHFMNIFFIFRSIAK